VEVSTRVMPGGKAMRLENQRRISFVRRASMTAAILSVLAGACTIVPPIARVGASFRAKVMDRGRPVRGLRLKLTSYDGHTFRTHDGIDAITDDQGFAQFIHTPPGSFFLSADHDGGIIDTVDVRVAADGPGDVTVPLKWPSETPLRVRRLAGTLRDDPVGPSRFSVSLLEGLSARVIETTETDDQGQFTLASVAAGIYFLKLKTLGVQVESRGQGGDLIAVELSDVAEQEKLDLDLGWSSCGLSYTSRTKCSRTELKAEALCGEVTDIAGAIIFGAEVLLMSNSPTRTPLEKTRTDTSGDFTLHDAKDGTYNLIVRSPGFDPLEQVVHIQNSHVPGHCSRPISVRLAPFGACSSAELVPQVVSTQPAGK
jgi:Carboxypeptidase regulatory-like domain